MSHAREVSEAPIPRVFLQALELGLGLGGGSGTSLPGILPVYLSSGYPAMSGTYRLTTYACIQVA